MLPPNGASPGREAYLRFVEETGGGWREWRGLDAASQWTHSSLPITSSPSSSSSSPAPTAPRKRHLGVALFLGDKPLDIVHLEGVVGGSFVSQRKQKWKPCHSVVEHIAAELGHNMHWSGFTMQRVVQADAVSGVTEKGGVSSVVSAPVVAVDGAAEGDLSFVMSVMSGIHPQGSLFREYAKLAVQLRREGCLRDLSTVRGFYEQCLLLVVIPQAMGRFNAEIGSKRSLVFSSVVRGGYAKGIWKRAAKNTPFVLGRSASAWNVKWRHKGVVKAGGKEAEKVFAQKLCWFCKVRLEGTALRRRGPKGQQTLCNQCGQNFANGVLF